MVILNTPLKLTMVSDNGKIFSLRHRVAALWFTLHGLHPPQEEINKEVSRRHKGLQYIKT